VYLSPEPLLQSPMYVRRMAQTGMGVPTYSYALNNPVRFVDPDGRSPQSRQPLNQGLGFWVDFMTPHRMRPMPPLLNNFNASSPFRSEMGCSNQGDWMRKTLAEGGYEDYRITMAGGRTGRFGLWPHQWVVAISSVDNSVLALDPWTDTVQESPFFEDADTYDWLGNYPTALGGPWESIPTYGPWPSGDWW